MKRIILLGTGSILIILLVVVLFFTTRQAIAASQADRIWKSTHVEKLEDIGTTSRLEILPLYEEAGDQSLYQTGHGLSYLIKTDSSTILMDVGNNPSEADLAPLLVNMQSLGVSWDQIDMILFSHFHPDHVGGVNAWKAGKVSFGGKMVDFQGKPVYAPSEFSFPGITPTILPDPHVLSPGVATTGSIAFGETYPISLYIANGAEQAIVVNVEGKGTVLIMGCGHPTVERIVARAEILFEQPVVGVIGGLHYEGKSAGDVQSQIDFLKLRAPLLVALSPHDSSSEALQAFRSAFTSQYHEIQVGQAISFQK